MKTKNAESTQNKYQQQIAGKKVHNLEFFARIINFQYAGWEKGSLEASK